MQSNIDPRQWLTASGSSFLALDAAIEITPFRNVIDQRQERKVSGRIGYEPCGVFS